jgi:hypothetical protein
MPASIIAKDFAWFFVPIFFVRIGVPQLLGNEVGPLTQVLSESALAAAIIAVGRWFLHGRRA